MLVHLIYSLLFGFTFYLVGHVTLSFWSSTKKSEFETFFFKSLIGIIFALVGYSIFKTSGNTIFTGLLLLVLVFLYFNKNNFKIPQKEDLFRFELKSLFLYFVAVLLFSLVVHFVVFPDIDLIHNDFYYFGAIADYLNIYGIESNSLNIDISSTKPNLYHYSNEWLVSLISTVTNTTGTLSLIYIYFPLVLGILYIGLFLLAKRLVNFNFIVICALPLLFFVLSPIAGGGSIPTLFSFGSIDVSIGHYFSTPVIKFIVIVLILIGFLLKLNIKNDVEAIFMFLVISFIWPTTTISIFGGVTLYILYQYFFCSKLLYKEFLLLAISVLYFVTFYTFQPEKGIILHDKDGYLNGLISYLNYDLNVFQHIKYFFGTAVIRLYYYIIIILIIILNWNTLIKYKPKIILYKNSILLYVFIVLSGLTGKSLLYFMTDSNQVFENIFDHTFMYLASFIILIASLKNRFNLLFIALFVSSALFTLFEEKKFMSKGDSAFDTLILKNEFHGQNYTFASHVKAEGGDFNHISQIVYPPLTLMRAYSNSYFPVNLSLFDRYTYQYEQETDISKKGRFISLMPKSAFYQYVMSRNIDGTKSEVKFNFLRDYKIDYLIYENNSLNEDFFKLLEIDKVIVIDELNVSIAKLKW